MTPLTVGRQIVLSRLWLAAVLLPVAAGAQTPTDIPLRALAPATDTFPQPFSLIRGLRELADGRVLVTDWIEERVVAVDFDRGTSVEVGRVGPGPREFRLPAALFPFPGDSTVLVDVGNGRLSVIGPDLTIHRSLGRPPEPATLASPRASDARGRIYFVIPPWVRQPDQPSGDSVAIARWDPGSGAVQRVAVVLGSRRPTRAGQPRRTPGLPFVPFAPRDGWTVTAQGEIVIVRSGDYSVVRLHDGTRTRGPSHRYAPLPVTRADKRALVRRFLASSPMSGRGPDGGMGHIPAELASPEAVAQAIATNEFAPTHPFFVANGVWFTPDGALWVERSTHAGTPQAFDVFDASGRIRERVVLPADRAVVGFGARAVYAVRVTQSDLQILERYLLLP